MTNIQTKKSTSLPGWVQKNGCVDATQEITINIRMKDIDGATKQDGNDCIVAKCLNRSLDAENVYVYRTTAYVLFDEAEPVERFVVPNNLRNDVIDPLDRGALSKIKTGRYTLKPPSGSMKSGEAAKRRARLEEKRKNGDALPVKKIKSSKKRPIVGRIRAARNS